MKNKKLLVAVLVLIVVIGALFGLYVATRPDTAAGAKTITVTVVHGDGSSKEFTYKTDEEYLGSVLMAEGLVVGEMGPHGLMISAVDGEEAVWEVNNAYWALYVGEEYATSGADTTPIYDGSAFKLEYTLG